MMMKLFSLLLLGGSALAQSSYSNSTSGSNDTTTIFTTGYLGGGLKSWTLKGQYLLANGNASYPCGKTASWLTYEASTKKLFCSGEDVPGQLSVYDASDPNTLKLYVNITTSGGDVHSELYHTPNGRNFIAIAHYNGNISVYERPLTPESKPQGLSFGNSSSKPHQILNLGNHHILVPDLGLDKIHLFAINQTNGTLMECEGFVFPAGSGPRRIKYWKTPKGGRDKFYVGMENSNEIWVLDADMSAAAMQTTGCITFNKTSVLPALQAKPPNGPHFVSEMRIKGNFLYVANRNDSSYGGNGTGRAGHKDSISVFALDEVTGLPTPQGTIPTGGWYPRSFIFNAKGDKMVVGNQFDGSLFVSSIDTVDTGKNIVGIANFTAYPQSDATEFGGLSSVIFAECN